MGVPLRRPSAAPLELFVPDIFDSTWPHVFGFCDVRDLGMCLAVDTSWHCVVDSHHVWMAAYERTQRVDSASEPGEEGSLRALIKRPFGEEALGWRVMVLIEDGSNRHAAGNIVAYSADNDSYLVAYDGEEGILPPCEMWEQERRKRTPAMRQNPSLAGKSRFHFLTPPSAWPRRDAGEAHLSAPLAGSAASSRLPRNWSWKQELESNVTNAPSRLLHRIEDHSDEVLFVVFSPCGTRLASCSRDNRTMVFRLLPESHSDSASVSSSSSWWRSRLSSTGAHGGEADCPSKPLFIKEAIFEHQTAPCRALWWPIAPYNMVAVSTEDAGWLGQSKVEIWEILTDNSPPYTANADIEGGVEELPSGFNSRCIFQGQNRPFDIYAAVCQWPPTATMACAEDPSNICFLAGLAVLRENNNYVQWLNVWPGPGHPSFLPGVEFTGQAPRTGGSAASQGKALVPLARLRLEGNMNYLHCLEVGPGEQGSRILAMTGSTPHLCDEIGIIDLGALQPHIDEDGEEAPIPQYDAPVQMRGLGGRVVLSAKWNQLGDLLLLNTRPYVRRASDNPQSPNHQRSANASFEDLLMRPAPDLSTSMQLLVVDSKSLDMIGLFDGHFAFTTKESPFLIFTDEWDNSDFLASGGEDHRVYIWNRRHQHLIRRLCGHTEPVNAVSWNGAGLLASASDDHSIIIWGAGPAVRKSS